MINTTPDTVVVHANPNGLSLYGSQVQYFSSEEINLIGSHEVIEMALNRVDPMGEKSIHLSCDAELFNSNARTRLEEVFLMGGVLAQTGRLQSMDVVEFDPLKETSELILKFLDNTLGEVFSSRLNDQHKFDIGKKWRTKLTSIFATHL